MTSLTTFEVRILRECNGELPASGWGAAVGAALEFLCGAGMIDRLWSVTPKGKEFLANCNKALEPR